MQHFVGKGSKWLFPAIYENGRHSINDFHLYHIAVAKLAVDRHVDERKVTFILGPFKSHPNCPALLWL